MLHLELSKEEWLNNSTRVMVSVSQGVELFHKVKSIKGQANYTAVFLHLSRLQTVNKQPHYIRIAATTFDPILLKNPTASVYTLKTRDIVFIGQQIDLQELKDIIHKVRYLFSEDPLAKIDKEFSTFFNLSTTYQTFYEISKKIFDLEGGKEAEEKAKTSAKIGGAQPNTTPPKRALNSKLLGAIEAAVRKADVSSLLKNKPVCAVIRGAVPQVIFYEKRVSLKDMISLLAPGVEMGTNPWFAAHMNEIVNERALTLFSQADRMEKEGTFSINLSLKTILSQIFQDFDRGLEDYPRRNVVIEVSTLDVISNIQDFYAAKEILAKKEFQICLSELDAGLLPYIDVPKFGVDFVKIDWNPNVPDDEQSDFMHSLKNCLEHYSASSVILAGCKKDAAIKLGHKAGMYLFQGSFVDKLVSAISRRQNLANQIKGA